MAANIPHQIPYEDYAIATMMAVFTDSTVPKDFLFIDRKPPRRSRIAERIVKAIDKNTPIAVQTAAAVIGDPNIAEIKGEAMRCRGSGTVVKKITGPTGSFWVCVYGQHLNDETFVAAVSFRSDFDPTASCFRGEGIDILERALADW